MPQGNVSLILNETVNHKEGSLLLFETFKLLHSFYNIVCPILTLTLAQVHCKSFGNFKKRLLYSSSPSITTCFVANRINFRHFTKIMLLLKLLFGRSFCLILALALCTSTCQGIPNPKIKHASRFLNFCITVYI